MNAHPRLSKICFAISAMCALITVDLVSDVLIRHAYDHLDQRPLVVPDRCQSIFYYEAKLPGGTAGTVYTWKGYAAGCALDQRAEAVAKMMRTRFTYEGPNLGDVGHDMAEDKSEGSSR